MSGGRLELQDRDIKFLELIGKYGYVTTEQAGWFYGTKQYHHRRLKLLEENGIITRYKKGIFKLGPEGRVILEMEGRGRLRNPQQLERRLEQVEIDLYLDTLPLEWEWVPSFAVKEKDSATFPKFCILNGILQDGNSDYLVYVLSPKPKAKRIDKIKLELDRFCQLGYRRAIVFCKSPTAMEMFGYSSLGLHELHLLPYPHGIQLLPFLDPAVLRGLGRLLFGNITVGENPQADFTVGADGRKTDVWFLATNDTARINRLQNYLGIRYQGITGRRGVAILCLEPQKSRYENLFPGVQVYTFSLDKVMAKLTVAENS